jgi:nucleoside-triphosphatase THEP1
VFKDGRREGYDMLDLRADVRRRLARVTESAKAAVTVGPYVFDPAAVEAGNVAIVGAIRDQLDVIVIDEVGPLEFRGLGWAPALRTALSECTDAQELIVVVRPSLIDELPTQFPSPLWDSAMTISPPWPENDGL